MRSFVHDLASVAFSKAAIIVFGIAQTVIIARWLGPAGVGTLAALSVYPSLFLSFGSLGLRQATTYYVGREIYSEEEIKRAIVHIWLISTTLSLIGCFLLVRHLTSAGSELDLVLLAISPIPFVLFNQYNQGLFLGRNDIQGFNRINWIPPALVAAGAGVLVIGLNAGITGALLAILVGPVVMSAVLAVRHRFLRSISLRLDPPLVRKLLSLGLIYAFALLVINLNYKIDVIMLDRLSTDYELGIYSRGAGLAEYLWQIPMLFSTIIFARSATTDNSNRFSHKVLQLLRISLVVMATACIVLFAFADVIVALLYGREFLESSIVLTLLLPGVLILTFYKVLNMDLAGMGKPWVAVKAMGPALIVNIVLNIVWVPVLGARGAAIASTLSYSVAGMLFLIAYSRETSIPLREVVRYRASDFAPLVKLTRASFGWVAK